MRNNLRRLLFRLWLGAAGIGLLASFASVAVADEVARGQRSFANPESAVEALVAANRGGRTRELLAILGPDGAPLIRSGDPVADRRGRARFVAAYDEAHKVERETPDKATLVVGREEWPFPIPLLRQGDAWRFDTKAGAEEILDRRIGRDELNVIKVCRAYVEAQREYAAKRLGPGGSMEYAQHFRSSPGRHDGLYWPAKAGEEESPLGPLIASARAAGYARTAHARPRPYHGYYFRILTRQGKNAPGGAQDYVVDGHMSGGFALIAYPAIYGNSGVMTFVVNQAGIVYEKNIGAGTAQVARRITEYDPDQTWHVSVP